MIGGGFDSLIGPIHRMAATMDGQAEIAAGAFSSDPDRSRRFGEELYLNPSRVYSNYHEMAKEETALPPGDRLDFIIIATPNIYHFDIARLFLRAGFNVICDKPMTYTLEEARKLKAAVEKSGRIFVLTHNYTGYPMVKQARWMVQQGMLGKINKVVVEYPQGWLAGKLDGGETSIDVWRMDPKKAGASCCMGDIGTHAENLARYITGLEIDELCADLTSFIPGNELEDDGNVLIHYKGGARGVLHASQISVGEENGLNIRVYGSQGGLTWKQENPNYLVAGHREGYRTIYSRGNDNLCEAARKAGRLPSGHPDGFIEAFANIYLEGYREIRADLEGKPRPDADHPTVADGVTGMAFVETVLASSASEKKWTKMLA